MKLKSPLLWIVFGLIAFVVVGVLLWNAYSRYVESKRRFETTVRLRWFATALRDHYTTHGKFPDTLEELRPAFAAAKGSKILQRTYQMVADGIGEVTFDELLYNPNTQTKQGFEYVKPRGEPRAKTPLVYQVHEEKRLTNRRIAYFDGSVK